jgi:hypothetical protein
MPLETPKDLNGSVENHYEVIIGYAAETGFAIEDVLYDTAFCPVGVAHFGSSHVKVFSSGVPV